MLPPDFRNEDGVPSAEIRGEVPSAGKPEAAWLSVRAEANFKTVGSRIDLDLLLPSRRGLRQRLHLVTLEEDAEGRLVRGAADQLRGYLHRVTAGDRRACAP